MTASLTRTQHPAATTMSAIRMFAGGISWAAPAVSSRLFGLGKLPEGASVGLVTRLFGVRDLVLGAALHYPEPAVHKAVLQAGLVCDAADVAASLIALRAGAPKTTLLGATAGAGLFLVLGAMALQG
ncbi:MULTISPECIES: hypothetical protein [unclassified Mycobacterium]|uniref:hypothetical protein n=1 Tax=unclassified Mycobacterium TaxID=2642494 RepID=UPI002740B1FF|nr:MULTISPECIES: hypothetical protein [unclassified Mycobacterium]MDP7704773.1 hypothetical protein [Mycobacterium sp. TY815]MDP7723182.1 hypothetical protein [Mycobacterium sp. TY814]